MDNKIAWTNAHNVRIEAQLASIGMRALGYMIDNIIKVLYIVFVFIVLFSLLDMDAYPGMAVSFILLVPFLFYSWAFETLNDGQTPGKAICKIKVTSMTGEPASAQSFFLRWIMRSIDFSIMSGIIALITAAASNRRQRVGDMVANTIVVSTKVVTKAMYQAYTKVPDAYEPLYPEAKKINREDIVLIKEILNKEMGPIRDALVIKMFNKLTEEYKISSNDPPRRVLFTVVKDYNYYQLQS